MHLYKHIYIIIPGGKIVKRIIIPLYFLEKDMADNADKILDMMKAQEQKTTEAIETMEAGLAHLQKKIRFYSKVSESVKTGSPLPKWEDVNPKE